jgi:hypothetical protein
LIAGITIVDSSITISDISFFTYFRVSSIQRKAKSNQGIPTVSTVGIFIYLSCIIRMKLLQLSPPISIGGFVL